MSRRGCSLEVGHDGVAVITLSNPPVNALHPDVLHGLHSCMDRANSNPDVKAIVVTGGKNFSAGFDIPTFQKIQSGDSPSPVGPPEALESGPKPTVAAISGSALGGGLEVAMMCNSRLSLPHTVFGLPELSLGIIPGFGGTQRLPRLIGLKKSLEMMLTSKPIKAKEALERGLIDGVVDGKALLAESRKLALDIAAGRVARNNSLLRTDRLEDLGTAQMIIQGARAQAKKTAGHLEHPHMCIDAVQAGVEHGGAAGLKKEQEVFQHCVMSDVSSALVHIFLAQRSTSKVRGVTDQGLAPRPLKCVGVIGGGLMGSGICTALALAGIRVLLKEVNQKFLDGGLARVSSNLQSRVKKGAMKPEAAQKVLGLVKGTLDYSEFGACDMVIEAVIEDIPLKQRIFKDLEDACRPDCILSTNTSTIDIDICAGKMRDPARIVGAHFFSPAHIMPLLEIVRSPKTPPQVVLDCLGLSKAIKKVPVVVGNCTGFAVNRVFFPYTMGACMLVDMGLDPYAIDKVINKMFGMPMGPFRLCDLVGADVSKHVGANFIRDFPERCYSSRLILALNDAKRLGEKSGQGFYQYDARRKASADPAIAPILAESRAAAGLGGGGAPPQLGPEEIIAMVFFPVVNEGCRVLAEGVVEKAADLDVACVLSMGFPAWRGGLIKWADTVGAGKIVASLEAFAARVPAAHRGFFKPCEYLASCARQGAKLGDGPSGPRSKF